jgi:hypothetical protein
MTTAERITDLQRAANSTAQSLRYYRGVLDSTSPVREGRKFNAAQRQARELEARGRMLAAEIEKLQTQEETKTVQLILDDEVLEQVIDFAFATERGASASEPAEIVRRGLQALQEICSDNEAAEPDWAQVRRVVEVLDNECESRWHGAAERRWGAE